MPPEQFGDGTISRAAGLQRCSRARRGFTRASNRDDLHENLDHPQRGHLHLIRRGVVRLDGSDRVEYDITEPTLVFLPRPEFHRLVADNGAGADVVCGTVHFGGGRNPVTDSLPDVVMIALHQLQGVEMILAGC